MAMMNSEMYDALIAAGAPEDKARNASIAMVQESLATKGDIDAVKADIHRIEKELAVIKWMLVLVIAATVIPLIRDLI